MEYSFKRDGDALATERFCQAGGGRGVARREV